MNRYFVILSLMLSFALLSCKDSSVDREGFKDNTFAQSAYLKVDAMVQEAIKEFTDPEKAANAELEMMNYATLIKKYPKSKAATYIRSHCDNYYDYALQKR